MTVIKPFIGEDASLIADVIILTRLNRRINGVLDAEFFAIERIDLLPVYALTVLDDSVD